MRSMLALLTALLVPSLAPAQAGLTPKDVLRLRTVTEALVSPDGTQVAFIRTEPRLPPEKPGPTYRHLWIMPANGEPGSERLLIGGKKSVSGAAFSPDGRFLTFVDRRDEDDAPEIYALPLQGGEPQRLFRSGGGVLDYRWRPDGQAIAFTKPEEASDHAKKSRAAGFDQIVVDEDVRHQSLWIWDATSGKARRLTRDRTIFSFEWAPDGTKLAVGAAPSPSIDAQYMHTRLHTVAAETGETRLLVENPGKLGDYSWSPDSTQLAYVSAADRRDPHAGMLYVVGDDDGHPRALTPDWEGMVHDLEWSDADRLLLTVSVGVRAGLADLALSSGALALRPSPAGLACRSFARSSRNGDVFAVGSTAEHPDELFRAIAGGLERMTRSNPWLEQVRLGKQAIEEFHARDGLLIQGVGIAPVGPTTPAPAPLVIVVHGGPEAHYSEGWNTNYSTWGQALAARGFYVFLPNYRASTGRGVRFAKLDHGDPMGREFEDHLDAIQHLAKKGLIDPKRVGIGGGSYGGYTAAWAATKHTEHFAAAVSFVPFVDIHTTWMTSDIPDEFYHVHYEEKWPHEQLELLNDRSPLSHAPNCRTPLLLLGGLKDTRVHPSQPLMLYRAVKTTTDTPVRLVQYPDEGHGNRTNTRQFDYLIRTMQWFEHYLRPGDHRKAAPPAHDLSYEEWLPPAAKPADKE